MIILLAISAHTQSTRIDNVMSARTYSTEVQTPSVLPLLQTAERQFQRLDLDGTFLTLENAIAQDPYSADALVMRAKFSKLIGRQSKAQVDLEMANRINPLAANLYGYYGSEGLLQVLAIEPEDAITQLSNSQRLNYYYLEIDRKRSTGNNDETTLYLYEKVVDDLEAKLFNEAMLTVDKIIEEKPTSAIAYDLKGAILQKQGKLDEALNAFSKAVELEPDFAIAWYNFAQFEKNLGHFEKAKSYLDRAIDLQEDLTKAYFARALILKKMGQPERALRDYDKIIDLQGEKYMEAYLNRGLTKKILGDYNGALADLNHAIEEFPDNAELRQNRGNLNLLFDSPLKAIDDYTKAIELNGNYAEAYYNRAFAFFLIYDKVSGCYDLDKSIDLGYKKAIKAKKYFCTQY